MTGEIYRERLDVIRGRMEEASEGRYPLPRILAVTKTHPVEVIFPLLEAGIVDIGENRVQEIRDKYPALCENFHFHMIGRLQTNKVKYIITKVCLIHSVDRMELADEIRRQALKKECVVPVLLQVSPCGEEQKGGCGMDEVEGMLRALGRMEGLQVRGLMAVMPNTEDTDFLDGLFRGMRLCFERMRDLGIPGVRMEELSMGMSHDYPLAARHGATMVRIGSALLGQRNYTVPVN